MEIWKNNSEELLNGTEEPYDVDIQQNIQEREIY